jgi:hypothetical protein
LSTGYIREWPPLLDGIRHLQRIRACTIEEAWQELQPALYEGSVKGRLAGVRYQTFRHDGIEPSTWYLANIFAGGSVEFGRHPLLPPPPAGLGAPRYCVEICWTDVLRLWPEPKVPPPTKLPRPTPIELDVWMQQHVTRGKKRDDVIQACHDETGATFRDAAAAWGRLPSELKLSKGQRAGLLKIEQ